MLPKLDQTPGIQASYLAYLDALKQSTFEGDIAIDYAQRLAASTDNSVYQVLPQAAVFPKSLKDLILISELSALPAHQTVILSPRGGGTGTNGQSLSDGIIVDLSRHMNQILEINTEEGWVRVQTGVVKDQLNQALKKHGLFFAPELSTSNRATIGGMINTDASGQGSCLYGKTRDHVIELKTVLLDGSVVHSQALNEEQFTSISEQQDRVGLIHRITNNIYNEHKQKIDDIFPPLNRCLTGYDLAHIRDESNNFNLNNILCGSEGTLGFICEAKLNVLPIPTSSALIIVKYDNFESSMRDATTIMGASPTSIETIDSKVLNLAIKDFSWHQVSEFFDDGNEHDVQGINLVEYTATNQAELTEKMTPLTHLLNKTNNHSRLGYSTVTGRENVNKIWAMRKRAVGLLGNAEGEARPVPFVEDTAVPPENLADFIMEFRALLDSHNLSYGMFGHVDAGVLHVRPALDMKDPEQEALAWTISDQVALLTQKYHGLLWGEHGKGVRSEYAPKFFGELYPQLQRIKYTFDPHNQLNPGKIATPSQEQQLLKISEVTTRGTLDREISSANWKSFDEAVYCNGNGACHNWNPDDAMCPSWKGTRLRTHTPKGRASLVREWLRLLSDKGVNTQQALSDLPHLNSLFSWPQKIQNSLAARRGEYDFSHEVYDSMAACLACKSCSGQCPIKVDVPEFRSKFLALYHTRYARPVKDYLVGSLERVLPIASKVAPLYNTIMQLSPVKALLKSQLGFVDAPKISSASLAKEGVAIANITELTQLNEEQKVHTVIIAQDAFTRYFETSLIIDIVKVLKKLGFNAVLAPYKPNGKPLHVHGFLSQFKKAAKANVDMLRKYRELGFSIIGLDPSMTLTYRSEYKKYLNENELVDVQLLQEWLVTHKEELRNFASKTPKKFKLMPHCTEKTNATASMAQWKIIFDTLGHSLDVMDLGCCGMAGTYGHETRNRETSSTIYNQSWRKAIEQHTQTKADSTLVATGYSCRCQVKREQETELQHPLQALLHILN